VLDTANSDTRFEQQRPLVFFVLFTVHLSYPLHRDAVSSIRSVVASEVAHRVVVESQFRQFLSHQLHRCVVDQYLLAPLYLLQQIVFCRFSYGAIASFKSGQRALAIFAGSVVRTHLFVNEIHIGYDAISSSQVRPSLVAQRSARAMARVSTMRM